MNTETTPKRHHPCDVRNAEATQRHASVSTDRTAFFGSQHTAIKISAEISRDIEKKTDLHFQRQNITGHIKEALTPVYWELKL